MSRILRFCTYCTALFTENDFESHFRDSHRINIPEDLLVINIRQNTNYECLLCNKTFNKAKAARQHCIVHMLSKHTASSSYKNPVADYSYQQSIKTCPFCEKEIEYHKMDSHFMNEHGLDFTYKDYLYGKDKVTQEKLEKEVLPKPITKYYSEKINCPVCQTILEEKYYYLHYKNEHGDKLKVLVEEQYGEQKELPEGYWCPESKIYGKIHKGLFPVSTFKPASLDFKIPKYKCFVCGKMYISDKRVEENKIMSKKGNIYYNYPDLFSSKYQISFTEFPEYEKEKKDETENLSEEKEISTLPLLVYETLPSLGCHARASNRESITIETKDFTGKSISINAFYCKTCKRAFTTFGAILPYFRFSKPLIAIECVYDKKETDLREFSELSLFGYDVRLDNLGNKLSERRKLLQDILDYDLIERGKILKLLKSFILRNGKAPHMEHARECWESDLDFVSTYIVSTTKRIRAEKVKLVYTERNNKKKFVIKM